MRFIVIVNSVSTQFKACYLNLIAFELSLLCSGRHMTGEGMNCNLCLDSLFQAFNFVNAHSCWTKNNRNTLE